MIVLHQKRSFSSSPENHSFVELQTFREGDIVAFCICHSLVFYCLLNSAKANQNSQNHLQDLHRPNFLPFFFLCLVVVCGERKRPGVVTLPCSTLNRLKHTDLFLHTACSWGECMCVLKEKSGGSAVDCPQPFFSPFLPHAKSGQELGLE